MRTGCLEFCIERTFPFRDKFHSLAGRTSSVFDIAKKFLGGEAVSLNSDYFSAEIIDECIAVDGCNPSCLKAYDGFLVVRDRLKMHGLTVTGKLSLCHSRPVAEYGINSSGNPEQKKSICHIRPIRPMMLHKEIIS